MPATPSKEATSARPIAITLSPSPEVAALFHEVPREDLLVHFGRPIDEPGLPRVTVDPFERRILRVATGAAELDGGGGAEVQRLGHMDLGHRDLLAREVALVEQRRRLHR